MTSNSTSGQAHVQVLIAFDVWLNGDYLKVDQSVPIESGIDENCREHKS